MGIERSMRSPHGSVFVDGKEVGDTVQCVHCGRHWLYVKGSGRRRGWCMNCNGITCGNRECDECVPWEKKLDLYEQGKLKILR